MQLGQNTYGADFSSMYFNFSYRGENQILCSTLVSQMVSLSGAFQNEYPQPTFAVKIKTIPSYICMHFSHSVKSHPLILQLRLLQDSFTGTFKMIKRIQGIQNCFLFFRDESTSCVHLNSCWLLAALDRYEFKS